MTYAPIIPIAMGLCCGTAAYADLPVLPSGQEYEVFEEGFLQDEGALRIYYLGVIAPEIALNGAIKFEQANADIDALCETYVLDRATDIEEPADEVVIRMMEKAVKYGETNPEVRQYMGFYDVSEGRCAWH